MITGKRTYETQSNCNNSASSLKLKAVIQHLAKTRQEKMSRYQYQVHSSGPNNSSTLPRDYS